MDLPCGVPLIFCKGKENTRFLSEQGFWDYIINHIMLKSKTFEKALYGRTKISVFFSNPSKCAMR